MFQPTISHKYSFITTLFIAIVVGFTLINQQKWKQQAGVISSDVRGYYGFLPGLFIHNDLAFQDATVYESESGSLVWFNENEEGERYIKYTYGMAVLYSPFFFVADAFAVGLDYPRTGFSTPYKIALIFSSFFFLLIGIIYLRRFLLRYFEDGVVSSVLLILYLGTNLTHYYTGDMTYSHGYSFALIAVFMYQSSRWLESPTIKRTLIIGFTAALFILIRPVDVLFVFFILLFGVKSIDGFKNRIRFLLAQRRHLLIMFLVGLIILIPQVAYLYYATGDFMLFSYTNESFYFNNPHLFDSLFSYRNGWLVYSPLMILSLLGLFLGRKSAVVFAPAIGIIFLFYFFIISSWWCWWYSGFGNRAYINLYPMLSLPLAAFIHWVHKRRLIVSLLVNGIIVVGIGLSLFQTKQFAQGVIHWGSMTKDAYWDVFGEEQPSQLFQYYLREPVNEMALKGIDAVYSIEADTLVHTTYHFEPNSTTPFDLANAIVPNKGRGNSSGILAREGMEYSHFQKIPVPANATHLHFSAWLNATKEIHLISSYGSPAQLYNQTSNPIETKDGWGRLQLYSKLDQSLAIDSIDVYFWNPERTAFSVDDMEIIWTKETKIIEYR